MQFAPGQSSAPVKHWKIDHISPIQMGDIVDGSVQDCSNSIASTLELLQSCT